MTGAATASGRRRAREDVRHRVDDGDAVLRRAAEMTLMAGAVSLPTGAVTFLLTDVAGSTQLWEREEHDRMREAVMRHYDILSAAVDANGGVRPQEQGEGDSIVAAFTRPSDALAAASAAQRALAAEPWPTSQPIRVRMAIHTGEAHLRGEANYAGQAIIRAARLRALAGGGQVLVSGTTRDLAVDQRGDEFELRFLGEHQLRDLGRPEQVWQLVVEGVANDFEPLVAARAARTSVPVSLSTFIGRQRELSDLVALVQADRLVTVTGTGGAGKTRLAQEVGVRLVDEFPAGVWWAELAPLDNTGVESALRVAFGIRPTSPVPLADSVRHQIRDQRCLLIVDNCEHVATTVATMLHDLLVAVPTLHLLVTSRVMLDIPGERPWRVPALSTPEPSAAPSVDEVGSHDGPRLFVDRAQRSRPNFVLTSSNAGVVAEICHRLGGIPLAIELAAARTRMLDPRRIRDGLESALVILAGGSRALMPRQQTLEASISWSYELLTGTEQALLRRLAVFVDGWTLEIAEAICPDPLDMVDPLDDYAVFDALDRLVDHSLVHTVETATGIRFGMLETVRQFAQRRLDADAAESSAVRRRHAAHFADWVMASERVLLVGGTEQLLDALEVERANLLAGVAFAISSGNATGALRTLSALAPALEIASWAPAASTLFSLFDQIEGNIDASDEWMLHFVRQRVTAVRGEPLTELALLTAMHEAAVSAGMDLAALLARCHTARLLGVVDGAALDDLDRMIPELAQHDEAVAAMARLWLANVSAYQGRLGVLDRMLAEIDPSMLGPIGRSAHDVALGMRAWWRGDAAGALSILSAVRASRHGVRGVVNLAESFLSLAANDLGILDAVEGEQRMRTSYEVDGNTFGLFIADWLVAMRQLNADDLEAADVAFRRARDCAFLLGLTDFGPNERYAFVAVGLEGYGEEPSPGATPAAAASNLRGRAEQALQRRDTGAALAHAHEALRIAREEQSTRSAALTLECISRILVAAGHHGDAARLSGACREFRTRRGLVRYPCLQRLLDAAEVEARGALGVEVYEAAAAEGATLSIDAAAEYAQRQRVRHTTTRLGWDALTPTEARVAELVAEGLTNPQVARELLMGAETVKTHLSRIFAKVGVGNRRELILAASRRAAERHR